MNTIEFCIPVRIDSPDRTENVRNALRKINSFSESSSMNVTISIVEMDETSKIDQHVAAKTIYSFIKSDSFSKAECVNSALLKSEADFFCIYDADVILSNAAIEGALNILRKDECSIVVPFNKLFLEAERSLRSALIESEAVEDRWLTIDRRSRMSVHADAHYRFVSGGVAIARRNDLLLMGGLNKKMISYGGEDVELLLRARKAGFGVRYLSEFNLIHLAHRRGEHSAPNAHTEANIREMERVKGMTRAEVRAYIGDEIFLLDDESTAVDALHRRLAELSRFDVTRLRHLRNMTNIGLRSLRFKLPL